MILAEQKKSGEGDLLLFTDFLPLFLRDRDRFRKNLSKDMMKRKGKGGRRGDGGLDGEAGEKRRKPSKERRNTASTRLSRHRREVAKNVTYDDSEGQMKRVEMTKKQRVGQEERELKSVRSELVTPEGRCGCE